MVMSHAIKFYKQLLTIEQSEIPVIVPVFNLVSYAKFMVEQLKEYNINNFIICDNNSTYPPMVEYLDELSKTERVVRFDENLGPRIFLEKKAFLSILPEYFIITDPDLVFNPLLPKEFLSKMIRILEIYNVSKVGFAIDIDETKHKFFKGSNVDIWEGNYWINQINIYPEKDPLYIAPIDTTFCLYKKDLFIKELIESGNGITSTTSIRIAGRFTCEHMGWWEDQILSKEEIEFYRKTQKWSATENFKEKNVSY